MKLEAQIKSINLIVLSQQISKILKYTGETVVQNQSIAVQEDRGNGYWPTILQTEIQSSGNEDFLEKLANILEALSDSHEKKPFFKTMKKENLLFELGEQSIGKRWNKVLDKPQLKGYY